MALLKLFFRDSNVSVWSSCEEQTLFRATCQLLSHSELSRKKCWGKEITDISLARSTSCWNIKSAMKSHFRSKCMSWLCRAAFLRLDIIKLEGRSVFFQTMISAANVYWRVCLTVGTGCLYIRKSSHVRVFLLWPCSWTANKFRFSIFLSHKSAEASENFFFAVFLVNKFRQIILMLEFRCLTRQDDFKYISFLHPLSQL